MSDEEFKPIAKLLDCEPGTWDWIWLRAGIECGEYKKNGGTKTLREFIVEYLTQNYLPPIPKIKS